MPVVRFYNEIGCTSPGEDMAEKGTVGQYASTEPDYLGRYAGSRHITRWRYILHGINDHVCHARRSDPEIERLGPLGDCFLYIR
jgi:hypothetical protein